MNMVHGDCVLYAQSQVLCASGTSEPGKRAMKDRDISKRDLSSAVCLATSGRLRGGAHSTTCGQASSGLPFLLHPIPELSSHWVLARPLQADSLFV